MVEQLNTLGDVNNSETSGHLRAPVTQSCSPDVHGWRPIETTPPAGTVIDVWMVLPSGYGGRWTGVMWGDQCQRWISGPPSQDKDGWKATHWRPVPPRPVCGGGK